MSLKSELSITRSTSIDNKLLQVLSDRNTIIKNKFQKSVFFKLFKWKKLSFLLLNKEQ